MKFDVLVVTASNEAQARGYRAMVAPLVGALAEKILVVPDPGGKRVGSLGSTVGVLKKLGDVSKSRVLICHSGGDSKRLPAYAAIGKAFVPVPDSRGRTVSLFERIVANMERLSLILVRAISRRAASRGLRTTTRRKRVRATASMFLRSWSPKSELEKGTIPLSNSNSKLELHMSVGTPVPRRPRTVWKTVPTK